MSITHIPVLLAEVVNYLNCQANGIYMDATLGSGGHAFTILKDSPEIKLLIALDWDEAGAKAIHRILKEELRFAPGVSCWVVQAPETGETDPSSFLESYEVPEPWHALTKTPAFDWVLARIGESAEPVEVCVTPCDYKG